MSRMRIVSGIQPTGPLHIGNYLGAVLQWKALQSKHDCFFFIADYHSLTENFDPDTKREQIYMLAAELLAAGVDPKKCTLFIQSDVPEVTELAWVFNTLVTMGELSRMTQFKDKSARQEQNINVGLFDYPVLQAADILLYDGELVPVGQDQIQHIEFTRDIARAFNHRFGGKLFRETKPLLSEYPRVMSLLEPTKKMSKSLGDAHFISLADPPEVIQNKIARAVTDTEPQKEMSPGVKNLFTLLEHFGTKKDNTAFTARYAAGDIRYAELKKTLAENIAKHLAEFRTARKKHLADTKSLDRILHRGRGAAHKYAATKMKEVRKKIGLIH